MWILIGVGLLLIILGLMVHKLKWYFLISGYNTMSKKKQKNVDTDGLGRFIGMYSYINGCIFIVTGILFGLGIKSIVIPASIFLVISSIYLLLKSQKFDRNLFDDDDKFKKGAWKKFIIPVVVSVIVLAAFSIPMIFSSRSVSVTVLPEGIEIHGSYGGVYQWDQIEQVELINELPSIDRRTNGSALGSKLKGHFRTSESDDIMLFVDTDHPPYLSMQTTKGMVIINLADPEATTNLIKAITNNIN